MLSTYIQARLPAPNSKRSSGSSSGDSKVLAAETVGNSKLKSTPRSATTASPVRKAANKGIGLKYQDDGGGVTPIIMVEEDLPTEEPFKRTRQAKLSSASATVAAMATTNATVKSNSKSSNSTHRSVLKGSFSLHLVAGSILSEKSIVFQLDYTTDVDKTLGRHESCDFHLPNDFVSNW